MPRMRGPLRLLLPLVALVALALPGAAAAADKPANKTLYYEGPSGRYLMDGTWLFRLDPSNQGLRSRWNRSGSTAGWSRVTAPQRLEPRRRLAGLDDRRHRLVPQGLLAARREPRARVGGALRVGQLPLDGVAQRPARGHQPRRLHPVRVPPQRAQAPRHQPARDPRRLQAPLDRLPALRPRHQRRADRRLVELLGPPARGLPQEARRRGLEVRARDPAARLRELHGDRAGAGDRPQRPRQRAEHPHQRQLRLAAAEPRLARGLRQRRRLVQHDVPDAATRASGRPRGPTSTTSTCARARAGARSAPTGSRPASARSA